MRALSYEGPARVGVRNKPDPRIEHPQDAVLRVTCAAICGSDLHLLHGLVPDTRIGATFGHEIRRRRRGGRASGGRRREGRSADGALQHLLRRLLLLRTRADRLLREHQPLERRGVRRLRLLAHDRRLRRRSGRVRARPVRGGRANEGPGRHVRRGRHRAHGRVPHRLPGRRDVQSLGRRDCGRVRRRARRALRDEVRLAPRRRTRRGGRQGRLPARLRAPLGGRRDARLRGRGCHHGGEGP